MPWQKTSAGSLRGKPRVRISPQIGKAAPPCRHSMNSPGITGWCTATLDGCRLAARRPIQTDIEEVIRDAHLRGRDHRPWPDGKFGAPFTGAPWRRCARVRPPRDRRIPRLLARLMPDLSSLQLRE